MDHFGIGQAMQGVAVAYFQGARRTGRTTSLLDSLKVDKHARARSDSLRDIDLDEIIEYAVSLR